MKTKMKNVFNITGPAAEQLRSSAPLRAIRKAGGQIRHFRHDPSNRANVMAVAYFPQDCQAVMFKLQYIDQFDIQAI